LVTWFESDVKPKLFDWLDRFGLLIETMEVFIFWFKMGFLLIVFVVVMFVLAKFSWIWIVPKIFPNMVEKEWLPGTLTYLQIFKLSLFFGFLNMNLYFKNLAIMFKESFENLNVRLVVSLLTSVIFLIVAGCLVFISWKWVVLDIFSKAVACNFLPSYLSLWNSILLVFLCQIIGLTGRSASNIFEDKK